MKDKVALLFLLAAVLIPAASFSAPRFSTPEVNEFDTQNFPVCYRYGCEKMQRIGLDNDTWNSLTSLFEPAPTSPEMERALLAEWIAHVEVAVGRLTNTQYDVEGTFIMYTTSDRHKSWQMDCVDEAMNVKVYLSLLEVEGKLRWHRIADRVNRGYFIRGYPHTATSIQEIGSGEQFVLDSWFYENGRPAFVLPLDVWKSGWKPEKDPQSES